MPDINYYNIENEGFYGGIKMKTRKVFALILTFVLILMSTACTTKIEILVGDGSVAVGGNAGGSGSQGNAGSQGSQGGAAIGGDTGSDSVTLPTDEGGDEASKEAGLETKEDIVKFYCDAYNKLGSASAISKAYDYTSNYNGILNIDGGNKTLEGIAGTLMDKFMVENTEAHNVSVNDVPPLNMGTINIDPNVIANATSKDMGDYFEIVLYSTGTDDNYEIDSQPGSGSVGSFGPLLRTEDVSGAASGFIEFNGLHSWYATATVTAHITKDGNITFLEFFTPCILHFDSVTAAFVVKVGACEVGLLFHQKYEITY